MKKLPNCIKRRLERLLGWFIFSWPFFLFCYQFRRELLKDLTKFETTTVSQIKLMASSIDAITETPTELDTRAQVIIAELRAPKSNARNPKGKKK